MGKMGVPGNPNTAGNVPSEKRCVRLALQWCGICVQERTALVQVDRCPSEIRFVRHGSLPGESHRCPRSCRWRLGNTDTVAPPDIYTSAVGSDSPLWTVTCLPLFLCPDQYIYSASSSAAPTGPPAGPRAAVTVAKGRCLSDPLPADCIATRLI